MFLSLWFKHLPNKKANELIKASGQYKYYFKILRRNKKFTLKENEEKIINTKDMVGVSALNNIYTMITSDFEYLFQGKKRAQEEMTTFVRSKNSKIRESAYRTLLSPYKRNKTVLAEIYKNIINDWREENVHLRGYKSPINVRNQASGAGACMSTQMVHYSTISRQLL